MRTLALFSPQEAKLRMRTLTRPSQLDPIIRAKLISTPVSGRDGKTLEIILPAGLPVHVLVHSLHLLSCVVGTDPSCFGTPLARAQVTRLQELKGGIPKLPSLGLQR